MGSKASHTDDTLSVSWKRDTVGISPRHAFNSFRLANSILPGVRPWSIGGRHCVAVTLACLQCQCTLIPQSDFEYDLPSLLYACSHGPETALTTRLLQHHGSPSADRRLHACNAENHLLKLQPSLALHRTASCAVFRNRCRSSAQRSQDHRSTYD